MQTFDCLHKTYYYFHLVLIEGVIALLWSITILNDKYPPALLIPVVYLVSTCLYWIKQMLTAHLQYYTHFDILNHLFGRHSLHTYLPLIFVCGTVRFPFGLRHFYLVKQYIVFRHLSSFTLNILLLNLDIYILYNACRCIKPGNRLVSSLLELSIVSLYICENIILLSYLRTLNQISCLNMVR